MARFIHSHVVESYDSWGVAFTALSFWEMVQAINENMPFPAICTGPDGGFFFSWDQGEHHLEAEFTIPDEAEMFYRDRLSEKCDGETVNRWRNKISRKFEGYLRLFGQNYIDKPESMSTMS
jgi:hypothetical protein